MITQVRECVPDRPAGPHAGGRRTEPGLRIAAAARSSGVPAKTIRFYEAVGVVPAPVRGPNGYRYYSAVDVRRLRLVGRLRRLGLPLADAGVVAERAFAAECRTYVRDVGAVLERQCREIDRQVAELRALRTELAELAALAHEAEDAAPVGKRVAECDACPVVDAVADSDAGPAVAPESSELPARRAPVRVVRRTAEVDGIR